MFEILFIQVIPQIFSLQYDCDFEVRVSSLYWLLLIKRVVLMVGGPLFQLICNVMDMLLVSLLIFLRNACMHFTLPVLMY